MSKPQKHFTWIEEIYQPPNFVDNVDFSFFEQYYKTTKLLGDDLFLIIVVQ